MNKRIDYLDYAKGLAVVVMLFAHTMSENDYIHRWIYSFHIPIFFIIGGILLQKKYSLGIITPKDWIHFIKRRVFQLGIPYFIWGVALLVFYASLDFIGHSSSTFNNNLWKLISFGGIDSLWFIPCYFFAELIVILLLSIKSWLGKIIRIIFFSLIICYVITAYLYQSIINNSYILHLVCRAGVGALFCIIGYLISKYEVIIKIQWYIDILILILLLPLVVLNGDVAIGSLTYNNGFLFIVNATGISISILGLLSKFEHTQNILLKFLSYFGKSSIVVLCTNNLFIEIIRLLDYKLTGSILLYWGLLGSVILTIILLLAEAVTIKISEGKLRFLFGKI